VRRSAVALIAGALTLALAAGPASASGVKAEKFAFKPPKVRIDEGEKVSWRAVEGSHTVTFAKGSFDKKLKEGDRLSRRFKKAGSYAYFCRLHKRKGMKGRVVVGDGGGGGAGGGGGSGSGGGSDPPIIAGPGAASAGYATPNATTSVGGQLSFVNFDFVEHDVVSEAKGPDGEPLFSTPLIGTGESAQIEGLEQVKSGQSYRFLCSIHPGMQGTLRVR
jgi:plastocyanin